MEKRIINPWQWQDNLGYSQAIEVQSTEGTLYCSGIAAMTAEGLGWIGTHGSEICCFVWCRSNDAEHLTI